MLANVAANVSLKFAVSRVIDVVDEPSANVLVRFLAPPSACLGLCAGFVLLASYLVAIRTLRLGFCYAIVTSAALVLITISGAFAFRERVNAMTFVGTGLIVLGIAALRSGEMGN